ncbi:MAG: hypothetical protein GY913_10935 [Proteobacteria bacterium]|nr:hypothetical protein [Pseudomonadota bacterium]MCP4917428.1 hypothetical protein [Pseudomonadota bacterium]
MSLSDALTDKLSLPGVRSGEVQVETDDGKVELDLVEAGPIGARVRRVKVSVPQAGPLPKQAGQICESLRGLGERLVPVEVDERLGGGVLRSRPQEMTGRRYYEVGLDGDSATVERFRALEDGGRESEDFSVTREQLGRMVDDLADALS